jgi:hypothetical protein
VSPEIDLVTLPAEEWREMLAAASELDLIHGGYFRARAGAILFYCSPEGAPSGWDQGFPDGSPDVPRAYVGEAEVFEHDDALGVTVRLRVSNWAAARAVKQAYDRGEYRGRFAEFVRAQEEALRGRPAHRAWLSEQFHRLRSHASGKLLRDL